MAVTVREINHWGNPSMHLKYDHEEAIDQFPRLAKHTDKVISIGLTGVEVTGVCSASMSVKLVAGVDFLERMGILPSEEISQLMKNIDDGVETGGCELVSALKRLWSEEYGNGEKFQYMRLMKAPKMVYSRLSIKVQCGGGEFQYYESRVPNTSTLSMVLPSGIENLLNDESNKYKYDSIKRWLELFGPVSNENGDFRTAGTVYSTSEDNEVGFEYEVSPVDLSLHPDGFMLYIHGAIGFGFSPRQGEDVEIIKVFSSDVIIRIATGDRATIAESLKRIQIVYGEFKWRMYIGNICDDITLKGNRTGGLSKKNDYPQCKWSIT